MVARLELATVDTVPDGARICHYDELGDEAKQYLSEAVRAGDENEIGPAAEREMADCDLVKFTEYYRISRA